MKNPPVSLLIASAACVLAACATTLPPATDPALAPGRELYAGKCHGCHRLHSPAKINRQKWPAILDKMAVKAKLTQEERSKIDAYVVSVTLEQGEQIGIKGKASWK
jgi:mono/diheme cytochrome c family protein